MERVVKINYGALADKIEVQLNEQGFTLGDKQEHIHKLHHAFLMCMFHLLTDKQVDSAKKKLHKRVMDIITPLDEVETHEK
jgi:hypothetical protein